ncbi:hypothetical protein BJX62DRAFT_241266 [Aspergillus germanicus]
MPRLSKPVVRFQVPQELVDQIVILVMADGITGQAMKTLKALRCVSRACNCIASPMLFRRVSIQLGWDDSNRIWVPQKLVALSDSEHRFSVRVLELNGDPFSPQPDYTLRSFDPDLAVIIRRFSGVRAMRLHYWGHYTIGSTMAVRFVAGRSVGRRFGRCA